MKKTLRAALPALALGALLAIPSFADTINLTIAGDAQVGANFLSFGIYPNGAPYVPADGYGIFEVTAPVNSIFSANGVYPSEFGSIQSLNNTLEPVGTPLSLGKPFMTFAPGGANLQLFLTELAPGQFPGSPFVLTPLPNGVVASFALDGYVLNTTDSSQTPFTGTFSATFNGTTEAQLLAASSTNTAFSGTFSLTTMTATPEPASLLLMGIGLLGAGVVARKKVRS